MMVINFTGIILFSIDKIIVGWILGPVSVTYYAVPTQVALKIHTALALLVSFLFPLSSEVESLGDKATLRNLYLDSMQTIIVVDAFILVFVGTFAREILTVWIGAAFSESASNVLVFTCLGYFMLALSIVPYHVLLGINRPRQFAILNLFATTWVICFFSIGLLSLGLLGGVILGMTSMLAMGILPWYAQRVLGISWKIIWTQSYGRAFALAVGAILVSIVLPSYWVVKACFFCSFAVVFFFVGNRRRHREMISEFVVWLFRSGLRRLSVYKGLCTLSKEK
jgi:O-antigen/teichoic acid export membrane protein